MLYRLPKNTLIIGGLSILLIACNSRQQSPGNTSKDNNEIKSQMDNLASKTQNLIGSASCTTDQQCHSIGFGEKPCGGFYEYKIYSDLNTDVPQLKTLIGKYNSLSEEWNRQSGAISDCMMLIQPELSCKDQTCQIK